MEYKNTLLTEVPKTKSETFSGYTKTFSKLSKQQD